MKLLKERKYLIWAPLAVSLLLCLITVIIYSTTEGRLTLTYIKVIGSAFIPAILPVLEIVFRKRFPILLNALITSHIAMSLYLGSAFAFYSLIPWWDLLLHGYFGFIGAAAVLSALYAFGGRKLHFAGACIFLFLSVMGCAALWEIFEFTTDAILGGDAQCVIESIKNGVNPIKDTMTDIIITALGAFVFYPFAFIDRYTKRKFF